MSYSDAKPLGNPADLIGAIQQAATAGRQYTNGPSSGIRLSGELPSIQGVDTQYIAKGQLAQFKYVPDFKRVGAINIASPLTPTGGFAAGTIYRHLLSQRMVGWVDRGDAFVPVSYSTQPKDGFSGQLIGVGSPGGDQPNPTFKGVPAGDAK